MYVWHVCTRVCACDEMHVGLDLKFLPLSSTFFNLKDLSFMNMNVCLQRSVGVSDTLELALQSVMRHCVGVGNGA